VSTHGDNGSKDDKLLSLCGGDAVRLCEHVASSHVPRHVLACLRERKADLRSPCRDRILQDQLLAAEDFRADWPLYEACRWDVEGLCRDLPTERGQVNPCLRDHRQEVRPRLPQLLHRV
jgi:hypothetical protein